jgi:uncharacterized protein YkwD/uncharacterized membrane protein required for colicin V production
VIFVDLLILVILAYAAFAGTKRGFILIGLELASFIAATSIALFAYHLPGTWVKGLFATSASVGNVAAFVLIWVIVEIGCALVVRYAILPRLGPHHHLSTINQAGGGVLNILKFTVVIALCLIVFASLPLSSGAKSVVTEAQFSKILLGSTGWLQSRLAGGLGRDLGASLNFFTVTAEPESEQRVELGYTTTGTVDQADEDAMLVLVNHERTTRGLKPLTLNLKARAVARAYSADMFARGYFSHIDTEGKSPFDRIKAGGVKFGTAGENLALAPTLALAHQGLMNSPGHRANILGPHYRTVGIGIIDGGPYGLMVTQDFTD